jgi:hypothetical protein
MIALMDVFKIISIGLTPVIIYGLGHTHPFFRKRPLYLTQIAGFGALFVAYLTYGKMTAYPSFDLFAALVLVTTPLVVYILGRQVPFYKDRPIYLSYTIIGAFVLAGWWFCN